MESKNRKFFVNLLILLIILIYGGCSSTHKIPECLKSQVNRHQVISWGEIIKENREIHGYELSPNTLISTVLQTGDKIEKKELRYIEASQYCTLNDMLRHIITNVQVLNAPGKERSRFIEYKTSQISVRAVWNPEFNTKPSKAYNELYDSLQTLINK